MIAVFPSRRFKQAGAAPDELAALEQEFAALSPTEQDAEAGVLARVDEAALTGRLDALRARLTPSGAADEAQAGEGEQKPAGEPGEAERPKQRGRGHQGGE